MRFRKNIRLKDYDYSTNGYYFVTVVAKNRLPLLKEYRYGSGAIAIAQAINDLPKFISGLTIDWFKIMDNHIHIIFVLEDCSRSLGQIVKAMKYNITNIVAVGLPSHEKSSYSNATAIIVADGGIWQWNYYEHIIRNEKALDKIRRYIENNPEVEKPNWDELDK
ncbi:MAG: transposase [Elusimicrobia bacterium]|nr:transposase [Elusimicrobiota bacterium]